MAKYQQRPVDMFVWDGDDIDGLRAFVAPNTVVRDSAVARVDVRNCPDMLVPGDRILRDDAGTLDFVSEETFLAMYGEADGASRPPKHVVIDFGDGHKIDIDVANTMVGPGECLRVLRDKIGTAKHDPLECTNGG